MARRIHHRLLRRAADPSTAAPDTRRQDPTTVGSASPALAGRPVRPPPALRAVAGPHPAADRIPELPGTAAGPVRPGSGGYPGMSARCRPPTVAAPHRVAGRPIRHPCRRGDPASRGDAGFPAACWPPGSWPWSRRSRCCSSASASDGRSPAPCRRTAARRTQPANAGNGGVTFARRDDDPAGRFRRPDRRRRQPAQRRGAAAGRHRGRRRRHQHRHDHAGAHPGGRRQGHGGLAAPRHLDRRRG